jgi:hypothetical protein
LQFHASGLLSGVAQTAVPGHEGPTNPGQITSAALAGDLLMTRACPPQTSGSCTFSKAPRIRLDTT